MTRANNKIPSVGAIPHNNELAVNSVRQIRKKRLRPNSETSHPVIGRMIAFETRYEVRTQVLSSLLAPRLPAMCGSATLAMLVSSTSIKAASETTKAINQGLAFAFHAAGGALCSNCAQLFRSLPTLFEMRQRNIYFASSMAAPEYSPFPQDRYTAVPSLLNFASSLGS